jgi:hypothetical protein
MIRLTVRVLLPPPAPGLDTSRNQTLDLEELDEEEVDCCATATSARREGSRGIAQEAMTSCRGRATRAASRPAAIGALSDDRRH